MMIGEDGPKPQEKKKKKRRAVVEESDDEDKGDEEERAAEDGEEEDSKEEKIPHSKKKKEEKKKKKKKLPPFNEEQLIKSIPDLMETMDAMDWKGVGHEADDVKNIIANYSKWGSRLAPDMALEDCVKR